MRDILKSEKEIQEFRENKAIEVMVHGNTTEMISLEGFEEKFKKRGEIRITIPSHDILQHNTKFPLHETSDDFLKELKSQYMENSKIAEATLKDQASQIMEQLLQNHNVEETANNVPALFDTPNETVRKKMKREIEQVLKEGINYVKKSGIIKVVLAIFNEGIGLDLKSKYKAKWGVLNNRRGQIGENKTVAAVNQALGEFLGWGMKTHSYVYTFLENMKIKLTYHNTKEKTNEVEHDHISA